MIINKIDIIENTIRLILLFKLCHFICINLFWLFRELCFVNFLLNKCYIPNYGNFRK